MEVANIRSLAELGIDHGFMHQTWPVNSLDELSALSMAAAATFGEHYHNMHSSQQMFNQKHPLELHQNGILERPVKQQKTNSWNNSSDSDHISNPQIIDVSSSYHVVHSGYGNHQSVIKPKEEIIGGMNFSHDIMVSQGSVVGNQDYVFKSSQQGAKRVSNNAKLAQAQDHILAERKRREKLSQRFIQLSALVPGLKKMDKASVLGDAIKYMKQLQDKVEILEEQTKKKTMESVVFVKKYELCADTDNSSSDGSFSVDPISEPLPEIEARFSNKDVLVRIHCEKRKGILEKTASEIEKLHLSVINSSVLTFGTSTLDITIIAQIEEEFNMSLKDLVKSLREALISFI